MLLEFNQEEFMARDYDVGNVKHTVRIATVHRISEYKLGFVTIAFREAFDVHQWIRCITVAYLK